MLEVSRKDVVPASKATMSLDLTIYYPSNATNCLSANKPPDKLEVDIRIAEVARRELPTHAVCAALLSR